MCCLPMQGCMSDHAMHIASSLSITLALAPSALTMLMGMFGQHLVAEQVITMKDLRDCGAVHRNVGDGIKLLARVCLPGSI